MKKASSFKFDTRSSTRDLNNYMQKSSLKCEIPERNSRRFRRSLLSPFHAIQFASNKASQADEYIDKDESDRLGFNNPKMTPRTPTKDFNPNDSIAIDSPESPSNTTYTHNAHWRKDFEKKSSLNLYNKSGLVGLDNLGNTCYMNAVLQCLIHAPIFSEYFLQGRYKKDLQSKEALKGKIVESLGMLISSVYQQRPYSSLNPMDFKKQISICAPEFEGYDQHDSHEFLRIILDKLAEELDTSNMNGAKKCKETIEEMTFKGASPDEQMGHSWSYHLSQNQSLITNIFRGQFMSEIECLSCQHRRICFDRFYDLSLSIPKGNSSIIKLMHRRRNRSECGGEINSICDGSKDDSISKNYISYSLEDCLQNFIAKEILDGENKPFCLCCRKQEKSIKRLMISHFPTVLVIHLKRFSNNGRKVSKVISFPLKGLDMSLFSCKREFDRDPIYDLFAVNNHMGSPFYGHYTA